MILGSLAKPPLCGPSVCPKESQLTTPSRRANCRATQSTLCFFAALLSFPAAAQGPATTAVTNPSAHSIAVANTDPSVKPGDDFYRYANGAWLARTEIPEDRAGIGVFSILADRSSKNVAAIIEEEAKSSAPPGSNARKIADLYNAYMDEGAIEARGLKPLEPHLAEIAAIHNRHDLAIALGRTLRADVDLLNNAVFSTPNLFGLWIAPGFSDSDHYVPYLLQGGLQMPSRAYYLDESQPMKDLRVQYVAHVAAMFRCAGFDDSQARANHVIDLERAIAETHISLADIEDIAKANNLWTRSDFAGKAPGLDWDAYFEGAGLSQQQQFMVWTPTALAGESALVASTPIDAWKDWLAYHLIEAYADVLPRALAQEDFSFFSTVMSGIRQQRSRWQLGVNLVNAELGDAVGEIYAQKYFSAEAKAQAQAMVANLIAAYHKRIDALAWLAPSTRAEAQAKLDTLYVGIGYPETWKDYSAYEVRPDDAFGNSWRASIWKYQTQIARIGKSVDRHEWSMTPQTVNAVNLPLQNALNFPAAILQPPFFDPDRPAAVNYGAIGAVIGHEISHTFDAEGSAFDSKGRVRNWWTPDDHAHFEQQAEKLEKQYDAYEPFPGIHVNGKQTIDENIADLGGVAAAYDGYRASLHGAEAPAQDGFNGDQQFFIAYAQNWASKSREAAMRRQVLTDGHSPGQYRADIVRNSDAWYAAFAVKPGETLYLAPDDRVRIW
jgi:putative endopeptidase